jgi:uncharacterized lipoprotein NlpE involved in copper resistance
MKRFLYPGFSIIVSAFICAGCIFSGKQATVSPVEKAPVRQDVTTKPAAVAIPAELQNIRQEWGGTYRGILPCADCEGIETILRLEYDETWKMSLKYLGKSDEIFEDKGVFTWSVKRDAIRLKSSDEDPLWFKVEDNMLIRLDNNGEVITGDLADRYRLEKTEGL